MLEDIKKNTVSVFRTQFDAGTLAKEDFINYLCNLSEYYAELVKITHYFDFDSNNNGTILKNITEFIRVDDKFITTLDFGTFKKSEDEGLAIRQVNIDTLKFLVNSQYNLGHYAKILDMIFEGLDDIVDSLGDLKESIAQTFIKK